jgi:hypothetical protein
MIELACSDIDVEIAGPPRNAAASRAYYVWSPHDETTGGKTKVWRISQFLGCEVDDDATPPAGWSQTPDPSLLVIDDMALGFRKREDSWPNALRAAGNPKRILIKMSTPLAEGRLWDLLLERFADRLTVVLSAQSLRERRAAISQGLSWDLVVEETTRELAGGPSSLDLARCRRVLVHFGCAGVACFSRISGNMRLERMVYHPDELEGIWLAKRPGGTFGATSMVAAAAARHELDSKTYPLFIAMGRALEAMRVNHEIGGGPAEKKCASDSANDRIRSSFHPDAKRPSRRRAISARATRNPISFEPSWARRPSMWPRRSWKWS